MSHLGVPIICGFNKNGKWSWRVEFACLATHPFIWEYKMAACIDSLGLCWGAERVHHSFSRVVQGCVEESALGRFLGSKQVYLVFPESIPDQCAAAPCSTRTRLRSQCWSGLICINSKSDSAWATTPEGGSLAVSSFLEDNSLLSDATMKIWSSPRAQNDTVSVLRGGPTASSGNHPRTPSQYVRGPDMRDSDHCLQRPGTDHIQKHKNGNVSLKRLAPPVLVLQEKSALLCPKRPGRVIAVCNHLDPKQKYNEWMHATILNIHTYGAVARHANFTSQFSNFWCELPMSVHLFWLCNL